MRDGASELDVVDECAREGRTVVEADEAVVGGSLMGLLGCCGRRSGAVIDMYSGSGYKLCPKVLDG